MRTFKKSLRSISAPLSAQPLLLKTKTKTTPFHGSLCPPQGQELLHLQDLRHSPARLLLLLRCRWFQGKRPEQLPRFNERGRCCQDLIRRVTRRGRDRLHPSGYGTRCYHPPQRWAHYLHLQGQGCCRSEAPGVGAQGGENGQHGLGGASARSLTLTLTLSAALFAPRTLRSSRSPAHSDSASLSRTALSFLSALTLGPEPTPGTRVDRTRSGTPKVLPTRLHALDSLLTGSVTTNLEPSPTGSSRLSPICRSP